jgi:hypothetical protein
MTGISMADLIACGGKWPGLRGKLGLHCDKPQGLVKSLDFILKARKSWWRF